VHHHRCLREEGRRPVQQLRQEFAYIRRDLDKDLVDYLVDCVRELVGLPFKIRFTIGSPMEETRPAKVQNSVKEYFRYLLEREKSNLLKMFRRSALFLAAGIAILSASFSAGRLGGDGGHVVSDVFKEGLTIAAWVSLWEAIAVFIVDWFPHRRSILVFRSIAEAELIFRFFEPREPIERPFSAPDTSNLMHQGQLGRRREAPAKVRAHKQARRRRKA